MDRGTSLNVDHIYANIYTLYKMGFKIFQYLLSVERERERERERELP